MARGRIDDDISQTIGDTPLLRWRNGARGLPGHVVIKHDGFNPYSSVKDRIGVSMLEAAIADGSLRPGMFIVEPTSGNTGIGLALAATAKGFRCIFVMGRSVVSRQSH